MSSSIGPVTTAASAPRDARRPLPSKRLPTAPRFVEALQGFAVTDDFGSSIPVEVKELEVIETYLGELLYLAKTSGASQIKE